MATEGKHGKYGPCPSCGGPNNRSRRSGCSACYQRAYRSDPERRRAHVEAVVAYTERNPEKRARWVETYRQRVGISVPALRALRRASKRLEQALANPQGRDGVRQSDKPGGDDAAER